LQRNHRFGKLAPVNVQLGRLAVGAVPRVVGTISSAPGLRGFQRGAEAPCDLVEVRLDLIGPAVDDWLAKSKAIEAQGRPVIFTLRLAAEGGAWRRPDEERAGYFTMALENLAAIDVELQSRLLPKLARLAKDYRKVLIVSVHDFVKTPSRTALEDVIMEASRQASIVKIATMINKPADINTLGGLLEQDWGVPLCVLGMGSAALKTRTSFPKQGSCLTYGYLDEPVAPGQPSAVELNRQVRESG
jgi:3-dehydroquinate dehydratase-1